MNPSDRDKQTATVLTLPDGRVGLPPDPLAELYLRYRREVVEFVRRRFGAGPPEPEDVAQAVFLQLAAQNHPELIQNPRAFLLKSAQNVVVDHHRRSARPKHQMTDDECLEQINLSGIDPERVVTGEQRLKLLMSVILKLPAEKRRMVVLSRFHGMSCEAIGHRLGLSTEAVQKQVERILKDCLAKLRSREGIEWKGRAQDRA